MRLTTGCFKDNQLQGLLREGDIWGLGFFLCLVCCFEVTRCEFSAEATVDVLSSICWAVVLSALSLSCQLFIWVYSNEERDSARLPSRAESVPYSPSRVSPSSLITLSITEHTYATKGHLCGICSFFLSSRSPNGTLGLYTDTRDLMRWQCKQRSLSARTGKEFDFSLLEGLKIASLIGRK